jgi:hypothetical protein
LDSYSRFNNFGRSGGGKIEQFTDKKALYDIISTNSAFYDESAVSKGDNYARELNVNQFAGLLVNGSMIYMPVNDQKEIISEPLVLKRLDDMLIQELNKKPQLYSNSPDNRFVILDSFIDSLRIKEVKPSSYVTIVRSQHIVYRYSKMYAMRMILDTVHSHDKEMIGSIKIENVSVSGFVWEDRLHSLQVEPNSLNNESYHSITSNDDHIIKSPEEIAADISKYFDKLNKQRGISTLNHNSTSSSS